MSAPRGRRKEGKAGRKEGRKEGKEEEEEEEEGIEKRRERGSQRGEGPKNERREREEPIFVREKDDG